MPLRTAAIALATVVLAALLYGAYWWLAAVSMRQGFDSWAAERRADGWTVSFGAVSLGGFPSRLALRIEAPSIGAPPAAGGWQWHGPLVVVAGSPWSSRRAAWTAPGLHRLVTASGTPIEVLAGSAEGAIERSPDRGPVTVTIEIGAATVLPLAGQPRRTIQRIEASVVLPDRAGPAIDLRVAGIDLGETPFIGLGAGIEEVGLAAELRGRLVPGARVRALEIWRDGGGTLEITRLRLRWQRIEVDARGTAALDRALQPIAALRVRPETLCRITEFSEHESNGRELDEGERVAVEVLPVLGQSAAAVEPGDGAFDHPTPGLDDEALHPIGSLDDLGLEIGQDAGQGAVKDRALIGAVGEQFPEKGKQTEQGRQQRETAVAILNVGGGDDAVQQQALRIDQNMPLLALDQLAGIEAVAVDASPPFSALFTL